MRNTDGGGGSPYANAGQFQESFPGLRAAEIAGAVDVVGISGCGMQRSGTLFFDAQLMEFPRGDHLEPFRRRRKPQVEWPWSRLSIRVTKAAPLCVCLGGSDSLTEYCRKNLVIRRLGGRQVKKPARS